MKKFFSVLLVILASFVFLACPNSSGGGIKHPILMYALKLRITNQIHT